MNGHQLLPDSFKNVGATRLWLITISSLLSVWFKHTKKNINSVELNSIETIQFIFGTQKCTQNFHVLDVVFITKKYLCLEDI